jgi:hypothetical protein
VTEEVRQDVSASLARQVVPDGTHPTLDYLQVLEPHADRPLPFGLYLGCWISLLTHEGGERWRRSFLSLATMCSDKVLGAEELAGNARSEGFADLVDELRKCQVVVANPQHRYQLPCPFGHPPVCGQRPQKGGTSHRCQQPSPARTARECAVPSPDRVAIGGTISFQALEDTDAPHGTLSGQHELSAHSQRHLSKLILESLLDGTTHDPGSKDKKVVLPLIRTHTSIISGSGPAVSRSALVLPLALPA